MTVNPDEHNQDQKSPDGKKSHSHKLDGNGKVPAASLVSKTRTNINLNRKPICFYRHSQKHVIRLGRTATTTLMTLDFHTIYLLFFLL